MVLNVCKIDIHERNQSTQFSDLATIKTEGKAKGGSDPGWELEMAKAGGGGGGEMETTVFEQL